MLFFDVCGGRTNLEEELDVLRVQAAMDRATVQELRLCLQNEQQGEPFHFHTIELERKPTQCLLRIIIHWLIRLADLGGIV